MTSSRRLGRLGTDTWEGPHVTETIESTPAVPEATSGAPKKRGGGLNSMLIADLKSMAAGMGIPGAATMKKAQLIEAIKGAQGGAGTRSEAPAAKRADAPAAAKRSAAPGAQDDTPAAQASGVERADQKQDGQG